jgi:L-lactate permease
MESMGRLAGGVAHDFNNTLGVILGFTELAMDKLGSSDPAYADLETVMQAARRSADITRQLLAFARKQIIQPVVLTGAALQGAKRSAMKAAMAETMAKLLPVVIALIAMLSLSQIMVHAGMIAGLSAWVAQTAGGLCPLLCPLVGVLGTFVTGAATQPPTLFTDFQQTVAKNLGLPVLSMVGAQGFGAAVGNIICPHNIIAGGATVGWD